MAEKTTRYTPEFRRQLVALAGTGRTPASLSKEFGPSAWTIGLWVKQAARDEGSGDGGLTSAEKDRIGKYAARLVEENDFVYIDGGTTTEAVIRYLTEKKATYVTNGLFQAQLLIGRGFQTYVLGGRIRPETEAIVGAESLEQIESYNFSIGFFGTNGITLENGFTTPDLIEGSVKEAAMRKSLRAVVLADPSKFGRIYPMTFGEIQDAEIITTVLPEPSLKNKTKITEADYDLHGDV